MLKQWLPKKAYSLRRIIYKNRTTFKETWHLCKCPFIGTWLIWVWFGTGTLLQLDNRGCVYSWNDLNFYFDFLSSTKKNLVISSNTSCRQINANFCVLNIILFWTNNTNYYSISVSAEFASVSNLSDTNEYWCRQLNYTESYAANYFDTLSTQCSKLRWKWIIMTGYFVVWLSNSLEC